VSETTTRAAVWSGFLQSKLFVCRKKYKIIMPANLANPKKLVIVFTFLILIDVFKL
jgi:hypothetical protein